MKKLDKDSVLQTISYDNPDDFKAKYVEVLKKLDEILTNRGIEYFVAGGTMLGAIRHRGFIPHDDDADIIMTLENYEKLRESLKKNPVDGFVLSDYRDYPTTLTPIHKFIDLKGTHTPYFKLWTEISGTPIDIFILIPLKSKNVEKELFLHRLYCGLLDPTRIFYMPDSKKYYLFALFLYYANKFFSVKTLQKLFFSDIYSETDEYSTHYVINHNIDKYILHDKEIYLDKEFIRVPFENLTLPIQKSYMNRLWNRMGGSGMRYIPVGGEEKLHGDLVRNYEIPHNIYKKEFIRIYGSTSRLLTILKKEKSRRFKSQYKNMKFFKRNIEKITNSIKSQIDIVQIKKYYKDRNYTKIIEYSKSYFDYQFSKEYPAVEAFFDIGDDCLEIVLSALMNTTGGYLKVKKVLCMIKNKRSLSTKLRELENTIIKIEEVFWEIDTRNYSKAMKILHDSIQKYPDDLTLNIQQLMLLSFNILTPITPEYIIECGSIKKAYEQKNRIYQENINNANTLLGISKEAIEKFPGNSEIRKYYADALLFTKKTQDASKNYIEIYHNIRDGFIKLDIQDKLRIFNLEIDFKKLRNNFEKDDDEEKKDSLIKLKHFNIVTRYFNRKYRIKKNRIKIIGYFIDYRFKLYSYYKDDIDSIIKLREKNKNIYDEKIKRYRETVEVYLDFNLGLCFNYELLMCVVQDFLENGEINKAKKLIKFVPSHHFESIKCLNDLVTHDTDENTGKILKEKALNYIRKYNL